MRTFLILVAVSGLQLHLKPGAKDTPAKQPAKEVSVAPAKVADAKANATVQLVHKAQTSSKLNHVGECQLKKNPGAGMDTSDHSTNIYKDGYWHVSCMMDRMESQADYHNEQTRSSKYKNPNNVSIVRYADMVDREKAKPMTPRVCFDFCRTVPDMLHFGLAYGRECYCTPYFYRTTGDGVCDAGCDGDAQTTCGGTDGMSDVYQMHSCAGPAGAAVDRARDNVVEADKMVNIAKMMSGVSTAELKNYDSQYDDVLDAERKELQAAASALAKDLRPVDAHVETCEARSGELTDYLNSVSSKTTVAEEVLEIETQQDALKECVVELTASMRVLRITNDKLGHPFCFHETLELNTCSTCIGGEVKGDGKGVRDVNVGHLSDSMDHCVELVMNAMANGDINPGANGATRRNNADGNGDVGKCYAEYGQPTGQVDKHSDFEAYSNCVFVDGPEEIHYYYF